MTSFLPGIRGVDAPFNAESILLKNATPGLGPIAGYTNVFDFNLVNFDWVTWHDYEWQNWIQTDALLNTAIGFLNIRGIWRPDTAYIVGEKVYDPADTSILYECEQSHTSGTSFTVDQPLYWTSETGVGPPVTSVFGRIGIIQPVSGDYTAEQIAFDDSVIDADNVQDAIEAVNTAAGDRVKKIGDTMTGALVFTQTSAAIQTRQSNSANSAMSLLASMLGSKQGVRFRFGGADGGSGGMMQFSSADNQWIGINPSTRTIEADAGPIKFNRALQVTPDAGVDAFTVNNTNANMGMTGGTGDIENWRFGRYSNADRVELGLYNNTSVAQVLFRSDGTGLMRGLLTAQAGIDVQANGIQVAGASTFNAKVTVNSDVDIQNVLSLKTADPNVYMQVRHNTGNAIIESFGGAQLSFRFDGTTKAFINPLGQLTLWNLLTFERAGLAYIDWDAAYSLIFRRGGVEVGKLDNAGFTGTVNATNIPDNNAARDFVRTQMAKAGSSSLGTYAFCRTENLSGGNNISDGQIVAASGLRFAGVRTSGVTGSGAVGGGTWRACGAIGTDNPEYATLFVRIT